jgi:predicted neutral ceramidase superfamily lipid hydrolase
MPWCPKCKYEYQPDVTICPDCGSELTEQASTRGSVPALSTILESAAISFVAPWAWSVVSQLFVSAKRSNPVPLIYELVVAFCLIFILIMPVVYGRYRRTVAKSDGGIFEGCFLGMCAQALLVLILVLVSKENADWQSILSFILIPASVATLGIWLGTSFKPGKQASR